MKKISDVDVSVSADSVRVAYTKEYKTGYDGFGYHSHDPGGIEF
ncbi:MAG: hypothetical protein ACP5T4_04105 [Candidatus Micrarchaeia archaeon]